MTEAVKKYLKILKDKDYRAQRVEGGIDISPLVENYEKHGFEIPIIRFQEMIKREIPILFENDLFGFHRYQKKMPVFVLSNGQESWRVLAGNITPNYARVIGKGFDQIEQEIDGYLKTADEEQTKFYHAILAHLEAIRDLVEQYRAEAEKQGCTALADALTRIPAQPAVTFYEACVFFTILTYSLRVCGNQHMTIGRFDQYMYPYYQHDIKAGKTEEEMLELLELFFISLNFDTDIYHGIQQGDNGQSMVLGGFDRDGNSMFNELSKLCMEASLELKLIDPKINLRCGKKTPQWLFDYATKMTKQGLGFPQYCNDDIVVPGLVALGYDYQDALNYTVAACWEYIIPNCSFDVPNIQTMNFPFVINNTIHAHLADSNSFEELMQHVKQAVIDECDVIIERANNSRHVAIPFLSMLVDGCLEQGKDMSKWAAKYNCFGCHGAGIAPAADALAAIKLLIYQNQTLEKSDLLAALDADFEGYSSLQNQLLNCPKMGNNDDFVDDIANELMETFSSYLNKKPNNRGGFWRAGTGSAMEYVRLAKKCPATADGRNAWEPYGSSFSPAITTKLDGPLSVIQSFTKFDTKKIINGGPLTMEVHDSVFRNEEGEKKVAQLVRAFIELGGHQLQLNSINRETLLDAQAHPEKYPNLIVRVWGWSGYFCELDSEYQNHIIRRTEFSF